MSRAYSGFPQLLRAPPSNSPQNGQFCLNGSDWAWVAGAIGQYNWCVRVSLDTQHRTNVEEIVATGQADMGLALLPTASDRLEVQPWLRMPAVAVLSPFHPLAARPYLHFDDLVGHPLILPKASLVRTLIDHEITANGQPLDARFESTSFETCCRLALTGLGIAISDPLSPLLFAPEELRSLRLMPEIPLDYGILLPLLTPPSETLSEAVDALRDAASTIMRSTSEP